MFLSNFYQNLLKYFYNFCDYDIINTEVFMRKNFGSKTYLYPQPVIIIASYDENGNVDAMNAAWGGISDYDKISICLSEEHKTVSNILYSKAFTVSVATAKYVKECDYFGVVSANNNPNKFKKSGMHASKSEFVNAPIIDELPLTLECQLVEFNRETGIMTGKIVNVSADESILGENGKIDPQKLEPITFDAVNNAYLKIGEKVGNAFRDGLSLR